MAQRWGISALNVCCQAEEEAVAQLQEEARLRVPGTDGHVDNRNSPVFSWSL